MYFFKVFCIVTKMPRCQVLSVTDFYILPAIKQEFACSKACCPYTYCINKNIASKMSVDCDGITVGPIIILDANLVVPTTILYISSN